MIIAVNADEASEAVIKDERRRAACARVQSAGRFSVEPHTFLFVKFVYIIYDRGQHLVIKDALQVH